MSESVKTLEEITITGSAARKIARLSALRPDAEIRIAEIADPEDPQGFASEALQVHFLDEYGLDVVARFVVRENGWSNPSVARARAGTR